MHPADQPVAIGMHTVAQRRISALGGNGEAEPVRQSAFGSDAGFGEGKENFSETISAASSTAFGAPDANSISRAEITPCASHLKRMVSIVPSIRSFQKSPIMPPDRDGGSVKHAPALDAARIAQIF